MCGQYDPERQSVLTKTFEMAVENTDEGPLCRTSNATGGRVAKRQKKDDGKGCVSTATDKSQISLNIVLGI